MSWEPDLIWYSRDHPEWELATGIVFQSIRDGWVFPVETRSAWISRLGQGTFAVSSHGVKLVNPVHRWDRWLLPPISRQPPQLSLSADGRGLRMLVGGRPRRLDIDRDRGVVVNAPADVEQLARAPSRLQWKTAVWHPRLDLVVCTRRWPRMYVRTMDDRAVMRLPDGSEPLAWSPDGGWLALRRGDSKGLALELWHAAWSSPEDAR